MIRFFIVESLKDAYRSNNKFKSNQDGSLAAVPKLWTGFFGGLAGAASVLANNPIDVVKTRMQGLDASSYRNSLDCARKIFQAHGLSGFYQGCIPRLTRVCLDVGITFMIYDSIMEIFSKL
ncbi:MAG: hypothetical protein MHPSP_003088 [Paramarteilia canceri]